MSSQRAGVTGWTSLQPRVVAQPPPELAGRLPVRHDDVGGEVVGAADERGADAVGVHRDAPLLEVTDLLHGEAAGDDDPHVTEACGVERVAHPPDEPLVHPGRPEVAHLLPQRAVDERLGRVEPDTPEPVAQRLRHS